MINGLNGIDGDIQYYLLDALKVARNVGQLICEVKFYVHIGFVQGGLSQSNGVFNGGIDLKRCFFGDI